MIRNSSGSLSLIGLGPRPRTARRFAPRFETSLRACGARRQVPIRRCIFVNGGQGPPFHTFPPVTRAANEFAAGFFARSGRRHLLSGARWQVPIRRCIFVNGGQWPPFHAFPPVRRAANEFAAVVFVRSGHRHPLWGVLRRVPIRSCLYVKGGMPLGMPPFHTFPPVRRAANKFAGVVFARSGRRHPTVGRAAASSDSSVSFCERGAVAPLSPFPPGQAGSEQSSLPFFRSFRASTSTVGRAAASSDSSLSFCERRAGAPLSHFPPGHAGSEQVRWCGFRSIRASTFNCRSCGGKFRFVGIFL